MLSSLPKWLPALVIVFLLWHFWPQLRSMLGRYVPGL